MTVDTGEKIAIAATALLVGLGYLVTQQKSPTRLQSRRVSSRERDRYFARMEAQRNVEIEAERQRQRLKRAAERDRQEKAIERQRLASEAYISSLVRAFRGGPLVTPEQKAKYDTGDVVEDGMGRVLTPRGWVDADFLHSEDT
jgi:hypothetical protein